MAKKNSTTKRERKLIKALEETREWILRYCGPPLRLPLKQVAKIETVLKGEPG